MSLRLSGIWITKNSAKFIGYSIASLIDILDEVIVMDGESTDSTAEIVRSFDDPKVYFEVLDQSKYNIDHSAKIGFKQATGSVMMLLGDDYLWDRFNAMQIPQYCQKAQQQEKLGVQCAVYNMGIVPGTYYTKVIKPYIMLQCEQDPLRMAGSFLVDEAGIAHISEVRKFRRKGTALCGTEPIRIKRRNYLWTPLSFTHWKHVKDTKSYFIKKYMMFQQHVATKREAKRAWRRLYTKKGDLYPHGYPEVLYEYSAKFVQMGGFDIKRWENG